MGEAKRKRQTQVPTVYHHTSTLRTNLIWMSGVIQIEGKSKGVLHPQLGEVGTDALARRSLQDFPPVAWLTTRLEVPNVLRINELRYVDKDTGEPRRMAVSREIADVFALNRLALGFPIECIPVYPGPSITAIRRRRGRS